MARAAGDQLLVRRVELVGVAGQVAGGDQLLQPAPLHDGGLVERGRRVGVVFEQLRRVAAVVGEIEAAVERGIAPPPAFADQLPGVLGNLQPRQRPPVAHDVVDQPQAEPVQFLGGVLDVLLDLVEPERVAHALVPIGRAVVEAGAKADLGEFLARGRGRTGEATRFTTRRRGRRHARRSRRNWRGRCRCRPTRIPSHGPRSNGRSRRLVETPGGPRVRLSRFRRPAMIFLIGGRPGEAEREQADRADHDGVGAHPPRRRP